MEEITKIPFVRKVKIKDFGIIKNADIEFKEGLNIIFGKSASGKTTIIKFLIEHSEFNESWGSGDKILYRLKQELDKDSVMIIDDLIGRLDREKLDIALNLFLNSGKNIILTMHLSTYVEIKDKLKEVNVINTGDLELNE